MNRTWKILGLLCVIALGIWQLTREVARPPATRPPTQSSPDLLAEEPRRKPERESAGGALESAKPDAARETAAPAEAASHANLARVRVRLVDASTHEPVPHLEAELKHGVETLERLESDAQGVLFGRSEFAPGRYVLDLSSERHEGDLIQTRGKEAKAIPSDAEVVLEPAAADAPLPDLAIPVGPTFELVAAWPAGLSSASFRAELRGADPRHAFDRVRSPVHEGPPAWVRFSPVAKLLGAGPPWTLTVTSEDAFWLASARVDALEGRALAPLALTFAARSRLVGRVLDPDGKPLASQWVEAWLPDASFESTTRRPALIPTQSDGSFDLRAIEPGTYTLKVGAQGCLPFAETLEVPALTRVEREVRLARPDPSTLAPIRGHLTSQSGRYDERMRVLLTPAVRSLGRQTTNVEWSGPAQARTGSFAFEGLAPGDYEVELVAADLVELAPRTLALRPGPETREFLVHDGGARVELAVRAQSAEDKKALQGFRVDATITGASECHALVSLTHGETEARLRRVPVGATVELRVQCDGRRTLWTSVVASDPPAPITLELARGWGAEITVAGPKLEPLEGAKVFLDDELAGTSDAKGLVRAGLDHVPQRCRVEYRDWKLAPGGEVSPDTGMFRAWQSVIQVRMAPAK